MARRRPAARPAVEVASVAFLASATVRTAGHDFRVPLVTADPTAAWVAEGAGSPSPSSRVSWRTTRALLLRTSSGTDDLVRDIARKLAAPASPHPPCPA